MVEPPWPVTKAAKGGHRQGGLQGRPGVLCPADHGVHGGPGAPGFYVCKGRHSCRAGRLLHAASDRVRSVLVPVNWRYPLAKLIPACQEYLQRPGRRPTFRVCALQWASTTHWTRPQKLAEFLAGFECHVNLIVATPPPARSSGPSAARRVAPFQKELTEGGVSDTLGQSGGLT